MIDDPLMLGYVLSLQIIAVKQYCTDGQCINVSSVTIIN